MSESGAGSRSLAQAVGNMVQLSPGVGGKSPVWVRAAQLTDVPAMATIDANGWPAPLKSMNEAEVRLRSVHSVCYMRERIRWALHHSSPSDARRLWLALSATQRASSC